MVANTNLHFQHDGSIDDLHAHVDNQLAVSTPLSDAGLTAQSAKITTTAPIDLCNPCMNGGVFVESEPTDDCSFLSLASTVQIHQGAALATVPIVADFELSFTLLLNQANEDFYYQDMMNIQDPNSVYPKRCGVGMHNTGGVYFLAVYWTGPFLIEIPTKMVNGGTYDIKILVKSGIIKAYIDGCLKSEAEFPRNFVVAEASDHEIYAVSDIDDHWIDGELSNIRYFSIGNYCSAVSEKERCECSAGFSGTICQYDDTPVATTVQHLMYTRTGGSQTIHSYTLDAGQELVKNGQFTIPFHTDYPLITFNSQLSSLEIIGEWWDSTNKNHQLMTTAGIFSDAPDSLFDGERKFEVAYSKNVGTLILSGSGHSGYTQVYIVTQNLNWNKIESSNKFLSPFHNPSGSDLEGFGAIEHEKKVYLIGGWTEPGLTRGYPPTPSVPPKKTPKTAPLF